MRKFYSLAAALLMSLTLFANLDGHFFYNVEKSGLQVSDAMNALHEWLDLSPDQYRFQLYRNEKDNLGINHLSYYVLYNGVKVNNVAILVHAKDDKVLTINGDILGNAAFPKQEANNAAHRAPAAAEPVLVRVHTDDGDTYRYAYAQLVRFGTERVFTDIQTGEVLKREPLVYHADVNGTAATMYNGVQPFTCFLDNGLYYLKDEGRNIITLDASTASHPIDYARFIAAPSEEQLKLLQEEIMLMINSCEPRTSTSPDWVSEWKVQLVQMVLDSIGDLHPDNIYIRVKDSTDSVVFLSEQIDHPQFPLTIDIISDMHMNRPPYRIGVWTHGTDQDEKLDAFEIKNIFGDNRKDQKLEGGKRTTGTYSTHSRGFQPMFDVHWGMQRTLDFYKEKFHRISYDGKGAPVYNLVNMQNDSLLFSDMPLNACALSSFAPYPMMYGMGVYIGSEEKSMQRANMGPLVSLDVLAHEFSHLTVSLNGNNGLEYIGESGALNESFCDLIGVSVKEYVTGKNDWCIASDFMIKLSNMRSLKDPHNSADGLAPQPAYYGEEGFWMNPYDSQCPSCDHGGVHTNSSVQNLWFYLLSQGGTGSNGPFEYDITGIGTDKAMQIAYRSLIYYLTPDATYEDALNGSLQAAIDIHGKDSPEHQAVAKAWYAVGVGDGNGEIQELDKTWQGIVPVYAEPSYRKILRDGQIYIIRDDKTYTVTGQEVSSF